MDILWCDIRCGFRKLLKDRNFTLIVVLIMALAIGGNTAIFSIINTVLLKPLSYRDSDRLVIPWERTQDGGDFGTSIQNFIFLRDQNHVFEYMAASQGRSFYITKIDRPHEARALAVSSCFLSLLGVQPILGRGFLQEEEQPGNERVVILSHAFWQDYLSGDPDVIGKTLSLDEKSYSIVGVMPETFEFPFGRSTPFWVPLVPDKYSVRMWARLKTDVGLDQARTELAVLLQRIKRENPAANKGITMGVDTLLNRILKGNRQIILLLLIAAGFVLLIACSNVINLLLVRATARRHEVSTCMALGASRMRIIRQMLTESLLLSTGAGFLGLLMTFWFVKVIIGLCPAEIPRLKETCIDARVLAFALGVSLCTGILLGMLPAWKASDLRIHEALKEQAARTTGRHGWRRLQGVFAIVQVGVSLILLIGAALLIRTLIALQRVDLGFRPENVLAMHIELPYAKYSEANRCRAFYEPLLTRVRTLPDVRSAALVCPGLDWGTEGAYIGLSFENRANVNEQPITKQMTVSSGYFETMGIKLIKGSLFVDDSKQAGKGGFIIDENLANKYFGQVDPIGKRINGKFITGVVSTVKDFEVISPVHTTLYFQLSGHFYFPHSDVLVKTKGDPARLAPHLRTQVAALEKDQVITKIEPLEAILGNMLAPRRFMMVLLCLFAGVALTLANVGVYGLLQYSTTQQVREIGIRMALGASQINILQRVLGQGIKVAFIGIVIGLAGAVSVTRILSSLLYDVTPTDPLTLGLVSLALAITVLLASYFPARRAAGINPINVLRQE
jgi:putative ABC transport system permease protein